MELSSQQHDQLAEFLEVWASPAAAETSVDVGPHLTCVEVDALARLMRTCGRDEEADMWLVSHSMDDGPGDAHYTLIADQIRAEVAHIAEIVPGLTLLDGDPSTFDPGHLILERGHCDRYVLTEICDSTEDDPERECIGYTYTIQRPGDMTWTPERSIDPYVPGMSAWQWATT